MEQDVTEQVILWHKSSKKRSRKNQRMDKLHYTKLRDFILSLCDEEVAISLNTIIEKSSLLDSREFKTDNVSLLLLRVKGDLEARGILKVVISPDRSQRITLSKKNRRDIYHTATSVKA